jgi:mono/diheme cytochrome c family protein
MQKVSAFLPGTQGNPQPFGMPPFEQVLNGDDIAAVATYVRHSWGNSGAAVSTLDVHRAR